jgi:autotransporter-associated beta strand protein
VSPNSLLPLLRFVPLISIVAAFSSAKAGSIAQSAAFPVMNQAVTLTVSADLLGTPISVTGPLGASQLTPNGTGQVVWTPARYGKYTLTCGEATNSIWVTARQMKFHWWDCTTAQKNVTEVMQRNPAWQARGVTRLDWTGGEVYSRGGDGHYWATANDWYNGWNYAYTTEGMALDEIFCQDVAPHLTILDAVAMVRQAKGSSYSINVWSAGFGSNFAAGAAKLKAANATVLIEDYYGGWNNHKSRWDAVRAYGLQNQAISGIWPGNTNLLNEAQIRADVALVRLAEPNANGIAIFAPIATNYTPNDLPTLLNDCDQAIEDYYLKPLIHLSVNSSAQLVVWNLGNEDAAGFSLQLLNGSGGVVQTIDLSNLVANGKETLTIPAGALNARVINPPETANLYTGNSQYSNGIYPLQLPGRYTWINGNGNNLWSTSGNWHPNGPPPGGIDGGNYAYFDGSASTPTTVSARAGETSASSVQFATAGWTINGNAASQYFYTYGIQSAGEGTNSINIGICSRAAVPAAFTVGSGNSLVMNGLIGAGGGDRSTGGLIKNGGGTLTVTNANIYTGGTSINAGTLAISDAGSIAASPVIDVGPSATLQGGTFGNGQTVKGTGKLAGTLTIGSGAILSPAGDTATGTMEITATLVLGGTVRMQFQKSGGVLSGDQFIGSGAMTCGGNLTVTASGQTLALGDTIQLFANAGGFGNSKFASISLPILPNGLAWNYGNLTTLGTITVSNVLSSPMFSLPGGSYVGAQSVTITADTGSTIYYSLDGHDPTDASPHAAPPIIGVNVPVNATTTLKAFARKSGLADSPVNAATYAIVSNARWNVAGNGNWSEASKWLSQAIPDGAGAVVDFFTFPQTASTTVTLDSNRTVGAITFGNASPIDWNLNATNGGILNLAASATPAITVNDSITATISAPIAGTQGLSKTGTGTLTLTAANTFSGGTSVNEGTLRIGDSGTLGTGTYAGAIANNGALVYASSTNQTFSGAISGSGTLTHTGSGTLTLSGTNNYSGATTVDAGKLVFSKTSTSQPGSTVFTVNPGATLQLNNTGSTWDGCGSSVTVNGGTATLGGSGTVVYYSADKIKMTGGTLTFTSNWAPYGNLSVTTKASPTTATVNGTAGYQYNPALNFNVERGTAASDLTVSLALGGTGVLNKSGAGVLTLAAACNYGGSTTVSDGTLLVNGSTSATSAITVNAQTTLGGTGNAAGTVTAAGTIAPGTTSIGTLATGTATLTGTYACQINGASADRWNIFGNLTLTGATLAVSEVNPTTFASTVIAKYTGTLTGTFMVSPALPSGVTLQYDAGTKEIRLVHNYNSWLVGYTFAPGSDKTLTGDIDRDGLTNRQEYAFGLNPNDGSSSNPITTPLDKSNATFTYMRRNPSLTGLTYKIWTSPDLATWTEDTGAQQIATDQGENQSVEVTLSSPAAQAAQQLFIRCSAE